MPFKYLESMSSGVPVITTKVGGIPEVFKDGHNGLFKPRNPRAVAENIIRLLDDERLARDM